MKNRYFIKTLLFILPTIILLVWFSPNLHLIKGVIWQPTLDYTTPQGSWEKLGADTLLVQWIFLQNRAWIENIEHPTWEPSPEWSKIVSQPWAKNLLLGLSGDFNLTHARNEYLYHSITSQELFQSIQKLEISHQLKGWYAPIEIDLSWDKVEEINQYLEMMPRPLYISSFVGQFKDPLAYAKWVKTWLPKDAHLLFQDSVGTEALTEEEAELYIEALRDELGQERVSIILEAFTISQDGRIDSASLFSIAKRLKNYKKTTLPIYIFSCRYITPSDIFFLKLYALLTLL